MKHVMLDLETLGTKPDCAILSIGAIKFSPKGLGEKFYRVIENPTGSIEFKTVKWWMGQSEEARNAIFYSGEPQVKILHDFLLWFYKPTDTIEEILLWCHGAGFDAPILESAFVRNNINCPWKFHQVRCTRTLYMLSGIHPERNKETHHNALEDAISQAQAAILSLNKLGWPEAQLEKRR